MQQSKHIFEEVTNQVRGIGGRQVTTLGKTQMVVTFGHVNNTRTKNFTFDIIDIDYPYNAIIVRDSLNTFKVVVSSVHLCMRVLGPYTLISVYGSQEDARRTKSN
jgi:hypothetical protein